MVKNDEVFERIKQKANLLPAHLLRIVLFCCVLLSSCQRERITSNQLVIAAEGIGGGQSKMYVDDLVSYWEDGDELLINGSRVSIHKDGSGNYYADLDSYNPENNYWGGTIKSFEAISGSNLTFSLPYIYQYRTVTVDANTYQKLEAPMVGYKTPSDDKLVLKHLTGVLIVCVKNQISSNNLILDRITISNNQGYKLSGDLTINYTDVNGAFVLSPQTGAVGRENTVIMDFGEGVSIANNRDQIVQIPVPIAGTAEVPIKFNIKVEGHIIEDGVFYSLASKYTFEQTQTTGGILGRAIAGYADVIMASESTQEGALFSTVSDGGETYYQIFTPSDWRLMTEAIKNGWRYNNNINDSYGLVNYRLEDDIDMSGIYTYMLRSFVGHIIDGNHHTITNLTVLSSNWNNGGGSDEYFGMIQNANLTTIRNLSINGMTLKRTEGHTGQRCSVGTIAAHMPGEDMLTISGVSISGLNFDFGDVNTTSLNVGGFIGCITNNYAIIENSSVSFAPNVVLNCSGEARIGGVATGDFFGATMSYHCTPTLNNVNINFGNLIINQGNNESTTYFGGVLGRKKYANVTPINCSVSGTVQINSNGTVCKGKVYGDDSSIPNGINVSGLTWN